MPGDQLKVASLNTRGIPLTGSRLAGRYEAIGTAFEAGPADVVCFQEVFTYWLPGTAGYVSDHIGLSASLVVAPP